MMLGILGWSSRVLIPHLQLLSHFNTAYVLVESRVTVCPARGSYLLALLTEDFAASTRHTSVTLLAPARQTTQCYASSHISWYWSRALYTSLPIQMLFIPWTSAKMQPLPFMIRAMEPIP